VIYAGTPDAAERTWTTLGAQLAEMHVEALKRALRMAALAVPGGDVRPCKLCGDEIAVFPTKTGGLALTVHTGNEHKADCDGLDLGSREPPYAKADAQTLRAGQPAATTPQQAPDTRLQTVLELQPAPPGTVQPNTAPSDVDATKESTT
jgi:hypothetical protein